MKATSIAVALLLFPILLCRLGYNQQPPASKAQSKQKPNTAIANSSVCPDPQAKEACDSYWELRRAHDTSLETLLSLETHVAYVCFRTDRDQFFVVSFNKPRYKRYWDKDLNQMVIEDSATAIGAGNVTTFDKGISDPRVVPSFYFSGSWQYFPESMGGSIFATERISFKLVDKQQQIVLIDASQFLIQDYKYSNSESKIVHYNLTLQRSTGRFTETFLEEDEKVPFIDRAGRCLVQSK